MKRKLDDGSDHRKGSSTHKKANANATFTSGSASNNKVISYGVLLYRRIDNPDTTNGHKIEYLLGLIPQRNWWTVFKGLPEEQETPHQTALREFAEETGTLEDRVLKSLHPDTTLYGTVGNKKQLVIFLQDGSHIQTSCFNVDNVVKIDGGYMKGRPEIVEIQWMTFEEAMDGNVKIYKSQQSILQDAQKFLEQNMKMEGEEDESKDGVDD